ncbi:MAG: hypothetical protein A2826_00955 [Candidatus Doudnabacteria bacterium RIFCSPHIGHO2_01_FULL_43_23]|uniref:Uncharacterized protein n=1 Tax=Candidatus Doudnabacteria bacterium RIFCSPHIGHO2_01_FULL_43_23 TaxID=1817822 RepID=A0A1F5NQS4_9BACT|nr:MAG: hypothetical protein A2826_00955 [Candidatus Doudnabacteria bacterium RIFCSPHIGHO2_01_FULL_43_23]
MDQQGNSTKYSRFYVKAGKISGWISALAFTLAIVNKLIVSEWLFSPSDLLQASLYLVLFAIFASMAALSSS